MATGQPTSEIDQGIGLGHVTPRPGAATLHSDPLVRALARYVEALDRRYPDGPEQMRREGLAARANMRSMRIVRRDPAA